MLSVPLFQSFRFRPINSNMPNFDNTFAADTDSFPYEFEHFVPAQTVKFQVILPNDGSTDALCYLYTSQAGYALTDGASSLIGNYIYRTYSVDMSQYENECCYIEVLEQINQGTPVLKYKTERFKVKTQPTYLTIEWFSSDNNIMNYSAGLTHILQLEAKQWKFQPAGESTVYINQGIETKLKAITKRIFLLECELPVYLADILSGATDCDHFFINEVEFVVSKKPTVQQLGQSDLYSFSCEVTQRNIIGVNSHDVS